MAAKWSYPETATLRVNNSTDASGFLITDEESTAVNVKAVALKGYKTPTENQDANAATSSYRAVTSVIYGLFGLESALILGSGVSQANAVIDGDFE